MNVLRKIKNILLAIFLVITSTACENSTPLKQTGRQKLRRLQTLPLNNPDFVPIGAAKHMKNNDVVVGVQIGKNFRAYPWWVLTQYHVVNDTTRSGYAFVITLCDACSGASVFKTLKDDNSSYVFRACGVENGTFRMCDSKTNSHWHPFKGQSNRGPLKGTILTRIPHMVMHWKDWRKSFPNSTVVNASADTRNRPHGHDKEFGTLGKAKELVRRNLKVDPALKSNELVFGIFLPATRKAKAYKLTDLNKKNAVVYTELSGSEIMIVPTDSISVLAYFTAVGSKKLKLRVKSRDPLIISDENGRTWNHFGRRLDKNSNYKNLTVVDGYVTEWFEWNATFPNATLQSMP